MVKHKIVYALSAVAMALGSGVLTPAVFADDDNPFCIENGGCYSTLQAAFDQVPNDGTLTTIYLDSNQSTVTDGGGAFYTAGKGTHPANGNYNVVFDLKGKTYVISQDPVGSTGYETQAFHLEKGGKFTFKDGTVKAAVGSGVWFILQNYAETTLDNVILDGSDNSGITYVASNNFGSLTVKGNSQILASSGRVAFDLWYGMSAVYDDGIVVNFGDDFTGRVVGKVEYGKHNRVKDPEWQKKAELNISNGTFDVTFADGSTGAALNGANINITGGTFTAEPAEDEIAEGSEAYKTEDGYVVVDSEELAKDNLEYYDEDGNGVYELMPIKIDMQQNEGMASEGDIAGVATFTKEFIADRKAKFEISELDEEDFAKLVLADENGELVAGFDASLRDRNNERIENVKNTEIKIRIELTKEQYDKLAAYNTQYAINYDDSGNEVERVEAKVFEESGKYYAEFTTTHLSTYALAGVNESADSGTPETGTMTREGASAMTAAIMTSVAIGLLVSITSFAYLIRRR